MREQLNLVTAAAEAADWELADRELTRNIDEQVSAERDRAFVASITKRQRDEYTSLLAAESARLVLAAESV